MAVAQAIAWLATAQVPPAPPPAATPRVSSSEVVRLEIGADDRLAGCTFQENGQPVTRDEDPCDGFRQATPADLRKLRGAARGRAAVTVQRIVQFAGEPPVAAVRTEPGQTTVQLFRVAFDVAPDGSKQNVRTVERTGSFAAMPDPSEDLERFVPAPGRTDRVEVTGAISTAALP